MVPRRSRDERDSGEDDSVKSTRRRHVNDERKPHGDPEDHPEVVPELVETPAGQSNQDPSYGGTAVRHECTDAAHDEPDPAKTYVHQSALFRENLCHEHRSETRPEHASNDGVDE